MMFYNTKGIWQQMIFSNPWKQAVEEKNSIFRGYNFDYKYFTFQESNLLCGVTYNKFLVEFVGFYIFVFFNFISIFVFCEIL